MLRKCYTRSIISVITSLLFKPAFILRAHGVYETVNTPHCHCGLEPQSISTQNLHKTALPDLCTAQSESSFSVFSCGTRRGSYPYVKKDPYPGSNSPRLRTRQRKILSQEHTVGRAVWCFNAIAVALSSLHPCHAAVISRAAP
jgi:hypothetical protein